MELLKIKPQTEYVYPKLIISTEGKPIVTFSVNDIDKILIADDNSRPIKIICVSDFYAKNVNIQFVKDCIVATQNSLTKAIGNIKNVQIAVGFRKYNHQTITPSQLQQIKILCKKNNGQLYFTNSEFGAYPLEEVFSANKSLDEICDYIKNATKIDDNGNKVPLTVFEKYMLAYHYVTQKIYKAENSDEQTGTSRNYIPILNGDKIVCVGYVDLLMQICNRVFEYGEVKIQPIRLDSTKNNLTEGCLHRRCMVFIKDDEYNICGTYTCDPCWDARTLLLDSFLTYFCLPNTTTAYPNKIFNDYPIYLKSALHCYLLNTSKKYKLACSLYRGINPNSIYGKQMELFVLPQEEEFWANAIYHSQNNSILSLLNSPPISLDILKRSLRSVAQALKPLGFNEDENAFTDKIILQSAIKTGKVYDLHKCNHPLAQLEKQLLAPENFAHLLSSFCECSLNYYNNGSRKNYKTLCIAQCNAYSQMLAFHSYHNLNLIPTQEESALFNSIIKTPHKVSTSEIEQLSQSPALVYNLIFTIQQASSKNHYLNAKMLTYLINILQHCSASPTINDALLRKNNQSDPESFENNSNFPSQKNTISVEDEYFAELINKYCECHSYIYHQLSTKSFRTFKLQNFAKNLINLKILSTSVNKELSQRLCSTEKDELPTLDASFINFIQHLSSANHPAKTEVEEPLAFKTLYKLLLALQNGKYNGKKLTLKQRRALIKIIQQFIKTEDRKLNWLYNGVVQALSLETEDVWQNLHSSNHTPQERL